MWDRTLAKEFLRLHNKFMQEPTALGKTRNRFNSHFFLEWSQGKASAKFTRAFTKQLSVWESAPNREILGLVASLQSCSLCELCGKYGQVTKRSSLCGNCIRTDKGQRFAQEQAVASVRRRWTDDYDALMEKQRATSMERYGTEYPWQSRKHNKAFLATKRETCQERYGASHHLRNSEIYRRQVMSAFRLKTIVVDNVQFECQGYEPYVLPKLARKFGVRNIVSQFDSDFSPIQDENLFFAPDFYIRSRGVYVEVKSVYTLFLDLKKNRAKAALALAMGESVVWIVAYKNRNTRKLPSDWYTWPKSRITSFLVV